MNDLPVTKSAPNNLATNELVINIHAPLAEFNLEINEVWPLSGVIGLFGHSGAGKSTLLKAIAGLATPASGRITLAGKPLLDSANALNLPSAQRRIVGVFQHDALLPHLSVEKNLYFGRKRLSSATLDAKQIISQAGLLPLLGRSISQLSGGERQKVALAQAILAEPSLLILDEPVTALDRQNKLSILGLIKSLQQRTGMPMLFVSHSISEHEFLCDQVYVMAKGEITASGSINDVVTKLTQDHVIIPQTVLTLTRTEKPPQNGLIELTSPSGITLYTLANRLVFEQGIAVCSILASDISICTLAPDHSSIVNKLSGVITDIQVNEQQALLTVNCQGQDFFSAITSYSLLQLGLTVNQSVYLQFKASALVQLAQQGD